jgi:mono/diheme cytochrome c family protein
MDDFRKLMYGVILAFIAVLLLWGSIVYISACGFSFICQRSRSVAISTPIPTLAAATLPAPDFSVNIPTVDRCKVPAVNLIGAWVSSGYPESESFTFTDVDGLMCQAAFKEDVQPLFLEANLWFPGSLPCAACHLPDLEITSAQLDLSSYAGMQKGSRRATLGASGVDIFGKGMWEDSLLYDSLFVKKNMPLGRPPNIPAEGPIIFAGSVVQGSTRFIPQEFTPTPSADSAGSGGEGIARPSNPGGPGEAVNLNGDAASGAQVFQSNCFPCHGQEGLQGLPNPGTDDGTIPALNPIDPTLVSPDYKTFATNLDLFIQHGSTPAGPNPSVSMPAWGDQGVLTQQQIADVIAYLISLNK